MSLLTEIDEPGPDLKAQKSRLYSKRHYRKIKDDLHAKRARYCSCGAIFQGTGSHMLAEVHDRLSGHRIRRGAPW